MELKYRKWSELPVGVFKKLIGTTTEEMDAIDTEIRIISILGLGIIIMKKSRKI